MQHIVNVDVIFVEHSLYGIESILLDGMLFDTVSNLADVAYNGEGVQQLAVVIMNVHQTDLCPMAVTTDEIVHAEFLSNHVVFVEIKYLSGLLVDILQTSILVKEQDANHGSVEDRPVTQVAVLNKTLFVTLVCHILLGPDDDQGIAMFIA